MTPTPVVAALHANLATRVAAGPSLLMFDIDGTLSPIAPRPEAAVVPARTLAALRALIAPARHVALVSGRSVADIRRMVPVDGAWALGNHGMEVGDTAGGVTIEAAVAPHLDRVRRAAAALAGPVGQMPGAFVEDKGATISVHYRLSPAGAREALLPVVERVVAPLGLRLSEGKKVIEVRPPVEVNKGTGVLALARRVLGAQGTGCVLFAGDDRTDEDAFTALRQQRRDALTVRVGPRDEPTAAEYRVESPDDLADLLELLAAR